MKYSWRHFVWPIKRGHNLYVYLHTCRITSLSCVCYVEEARKYTAQHIWGVMQWWCRCNSMASILPSAACILWISLGHKALSQVKDERKGGNIGVGIEARNRVKSFFTVFFWFNENARSKSKLMDSFEDSFRL